MESSSFGTDEESIPVEEDENHQTNRQMTQNNPKSEVKPSMAEDSVVSSSFDDDGDGDVGSSVNQGAF